ncbi:MAG: single-stranded DNA-binding protein, partial [Candidatus Methanomethylophilaceae archaeon]
MEMNELTPHLEELKRVLENKVDEEQLVEDLNTYINVYHLDLEAAKRGIVRKYGGNNIGFVTAEAVSKKIGDLNGSEQNVDILAKVVFFEKKEVTARGEKKIIVSGILGDETATASFTVWDGASCELEKGAVYTFKNAYVKMWNDRVQIHLGNRGIIEKSNTDIQLPERNISYSSSEAKISDLKEGIGNVTVTGRILTVETRNIIVKGEQKVVYSGLMADDTGKIQFSAWNDFGLKEGETICITNAYIRGWKGIPQLNLGERCEVSRVDDNFQDADIGGSSVKTVGEIVRTGGGLDITLSGTVVDLRMGSGLIKRCPECNRSVLNNECVSHGTIIPKLDLRMKVVVDDGTGAISAVINRECT